MRSSEATSLAGYEPGTYLVAWWPGFDYPALEVGRISADCSFVHHVKARNADGSDDDDNNYDPGNPRGPVWGGDGEAHFSFAVPPDHPAYDTFAAFEATCVMGAPRWGLVEEHLV